jgi:signal transduction histidine kinase
MQSLMRTFRNAERDAGRAPVLVIIGHSPATFVIVDQCRAATRIGNSGCRLYRAAPCPRGASATRGLFNAGRVGLRRSVERLRGVAVTAQAAGAVKKICKCVLRPVQSASPRGLVTIERKTQQVLFNLLSNAIKFTPPGGHISVFARFDPQSGLSLGVRDTGIGIAAENLDRVFEPFVQVDSQLNRQHQGTGLGLAIVKAVMALHQGAVELKSIKGNGTEVTVIFPPDRLNALYPLSEQDFNCSPFEPQNADAGGQ